MNTKTIIALLGIISCTGAKAGLPACDALRACSNDLAVQMAKCCGWRAATIQQYRRMDHANFEAAPNAAAMCKSVWQTISYNALKFYERGRLKEFPKTCDH